MPPRRYKSIPPFLASYDAAMRWVKRNHDGDDEEQREWIEDRVGDYTDFAERAYAAGEITIYRAVRVPKSADGRHRVDLKCLGKSWSREQARAGVYGVAPREGDELLIVGRVQPRDIDWAYGFQSFLYYGTDQWEVSMLEHSPVQVDRIEVRGERRWVNDPAARFGQRQVEENTVILTGPVLGDTGPAGESWQQECGPKAVAKRARETNPLPAALPPKSAAKVDRLYREATDPTFVRASTAKKLRGGNPLTLSAARGRAGTKKRRPRLPDDVGSPAELVALVNEAASRLNVEIENRILGCGSNGCVVPVKANRLALKHQPLVLKLSSSHSERTMLEAVRQVRAYEGFALIVDGPLSLRSNPLFFAYVREDVAPYLEPGVNDDPNYWEPFLTDASDAAGDGWAEGFLAALDAFQPPYLEIAMTMRRLHDEAGVMVFDANPQNMGWRADGTLVLYDGEAADWERGV